MNEWMRQLLFLPEQASTIAPEIDALHYFVIGTTMVGATAVAVVTLYFLVKYRERAARGGFEPPDPRPHHTAGGMPVALELGIFGGLLALFVLWWVIGFRQYVKIADPPDDSLPIYVTGKQWMWSFAYPNGTGSNGTLYVPVGRPVKLVMTSRDVIHSFYVPAFRVKRDVLPGRTTTMWFEAKQPGRYHVFCAEFCGTQHSTMRAWVVAVPPDDFQRRIDELEPVEIAAPDSAPPFVPGSARPREALSLAAVGEKVAADAGCMRCHTVDGTPHIGPTWAGLYRARIPLATGQEIIADEAYLTSSMMDPAAQLHRGFLPVMPSYQGLLTAPQVGAIVEFIRSLRDRPRVQLAEPLPVGEAPIVTPLPGVKP